MRHHRAESWEAKLKELFDEIDAELEKKYIGQYRRHPARPPRGATSNPEADGLFNIGASFTPGYGSEKGRGYVVQIDMATLTDVPDEVEEQIDQEVIEKIRQKIPTYFPDRELHVERDGRVFKITGDLSL